MMATNAVPNKPIGFKLELNGFTETSVDIFATTFYQRSDESVCIATLKDRKLAQLIVTAVNYYLQHRRLGADKPPVY